MKIRPILVSRALGPLAAFALSLLLTSYTALASDPSTDTLAPEVTDSAGQTLTLDAPAKRILALAPHLVENAYSAGAGDRLVGAVDYADYPKAARDLPRVGSANKLNQETILALKPDLVLAWQSGNDPKTLRQLKRLGLTVYVDEPNKLQDVARSIRHIGALAGTGNTANEAARDYLQTLEALREQYSEKTPVSVFYQVWHDPLQTLNGEHLISDVIRLCGGRNVFANAASLAPTVSMESMLKRNPEVIIASGREEDNPEWRDRWDEWSTLAAVQRGQLFFVHPDLIQRHTLRILDGARLFCEHIDEARTSKSRTTNVR